MSAGHRWHSIGDEILRFLVAAYQSEGKVHWPTLVSACGALAGESVLLGSAPDMTEEGFVSSKKVSQLVYCDQTPHRSLYGYAAAIAEQAFGVKAQDLPTFEAMAAQIGTTLLPGGFPALAVPMHVMPHESPLNAGPRHRKSISAIAAHHMVDYRDSAFALMTAAMKGVGFTRMVGMADMTSLALQSTVAASRFVPLVSVSDSPAYGLITDIIPREQNAQIAPPVLEKGAVDIWGEEIQKPQPDASAEPRVAPYVVDSEEPEQRVAFGRRR